MTSAAPEVEPSEDLLSTFSPEEGDSTQVVVVESVVGPSKDLLVSTFSLEAGDSTPAAAAALVVEVEPSEDLAKPGPLNYLVEVDPLKDLITSTYYRPVDENDTVRLCAIIDTCTEYPTDPHLFCDTPVTPDLVRAPLELGPCQPGLKDNFDSFPKDEDGRHFSPTWYKKKMKNGCEIDRHWLVYSPRENTMIYIPCWLFANRSNRWSDPKTGCKIFAKGTHKIENMKKVKVTSKQRNNFSLPNFDCSMTELF